jgi:hypothetical protein
VIWFQPESRAEVCHRFHELATIAKSNPEIIVEVCHPRITGDGFTDTGDRRRVVTHLIGNDSAQVQGTGIAGIDLEHLAAEHVCLAEITTRLTGLGPGENVCAGDCLR